MSNSKAKGLKTFWLDQVDAAQYHTEWEQRTVLPSSLNHMLSSCLLTVSPILCQQLQLYDTRSEADLPQHIDDKS